MKRLTLAEVRAIETDPAHTSLHIADFIVAALEPLFVLGAGSDAEALALVRRAIASLQDAAALLAATVGPAQGPARLRAKWPAMPEGGRSVDITEQPF